MLHSSIYNSYVCKANNNVREGRGLNNVPFSGRHHSPAGLDSHRNKKTTSGKQAKVFGKRKQKNGNNSGTKLKAMKTTINF